MSVMTPFLGVQHPLFPWDDAESAAGDRGAVTALGEQEQTPNVTGHGGRAQCPSALSHLQVKGFCVFPASSPGMFPNSNCSQCKKTPSKKIHGWWLPAHWCRLSGFTGLSQYFGASGKSVAVFRTFEILKTV